MKWLTTFSVVIRSQVTALCEHFENPQRVLDQLILDMEEDLERVRDNVASVLADEIQLAGQVNKARADAELWQERAGKALSGGDEAAARGALEQKLAAQARATGLADELSKHRQESAKLQAAVRDLEQKIRQARTKRSLLLARLARVESANQIHSVLRQTSNSSALAQFQRLESRLERAEALEQAQEQLDSGTTPAAADLERQFAEREQRERLQQEFEELKRRVGGGD